METINQILSTLDSNSIILTIIGFLLIHYVRSFATKEDLSENMHRIDIELRDIKNTLDSLRRNK